MSREEEMAVLLNDIKMVKNFITISISSN
jgi:hypothetical protein